MALNPYDEDVKKRQGNYVEDFNNLPEYQQQEVEEETPDPNPNRVVVKPGVPEKSRSQQILESIYSSAAPPPPVYNEQLQKRRERVARLNATGRGFNVLGDVLSLGLGANVKQRQPDQVTPAMLNSYQNYIQQYDDRMDRFNYQNYRDNLANKRLLYSDAARQEDIQRNDKRYAEQQGWKQKEWDERQKKYAEEPERRMQIDEKRQEQKIAEALKRHELRMKEIAAREKYSKSRGTGSSPERTFKVELPSGEVQTFSPEGYSMMRDLAMQSADLLPKHLFEKVPVTDQLKNQLRDAQGNPMFEFQLKRTAKDDDLIRAYLVMMDKMKAWNEEPAQLIPVERPGYERPQQTTEQQPQEKITIDTTKFKGVPAQGF